MSEEEKKKSSDKKTERLNNKLRIKELQFEALLDITNSINHDFSTLVVIEKFKHFVKDQLHIDKLILFSKFAKWRVLLDYGTSEEELENIDVDRDLIHINKIDSIVSVQNNALKGFDLVVPVYQGEKALAYLLLGDVSDDERSVSSIIKHLNFLQLLTNICVSAIENQRLAKEVLKQEQQRRKMIEKQNETLEVLVKERTKELEAEKEESERLLHNILPRKIANELKLNGSIEPLRYNEASVLFTDFKGFTATSSTISPQELVTELNDIFKGFDYIMEKHGVEKIKTIGDAYMAACGIPIESDNHALRIIYAAFDMITFLHERGKRSKIKWEMRVGVHSGPLVAGVVGTKKFTYDIWGDTVNTGSRMESNSEPGRINISQTTFDLIKHQFNCEYRGKLSAKGKGEIDMYFVNNEIMPERFLQARNIAENLLNQLDQKLYYHCKAHSLDVHDAVNILCLNENMADQERELARVAALFHDTGFLRQYKENEEKGCEIVKENLPSLGYSDEEINIICNMIMATKVPQNPKSKLDEIICDADLDYLGRMDFYTIGGNLHQELLEHGVDLSKKQWDEMQVKFLNIHTYFTNTSREFRNDGKQKHLDKIQYALSSSV
ncbi:MAG: HD domain-containing protein [Sphingobacteriaceae bacterium]|nr:HD domain-containing protein [Sphingobacteriaceae bacterium]